MEPTKNPTPSASEPPKNDDIRVRDEYQSEAYSGGTSSEERSRKREDRGLRGFYTLIIIGTGSAGLPAGMYASRYAIDNLIIGALPGGALATSHQVDNYPGVISDSGHHIMERFREHAEASGSEIIADEVVSLDRTDAGFAVRTALGGAYTCRYLLLATGNNYRHLGVP